jgi:hypothetical protein
VGDPPRRRDLPNGWLISTVFIPIDMGHGLDDRGPVLFESMVFPDRARDWCSRDADCIRYRTEAQARIGHAHLVNVFRKRKPPRFDAKGW